MTTDQKIDMLIDAFHDFGRNIDNRINGLELKMDTRIDNLEQKMDTRINDLEQKMDNRFAIMDERMSTMVTKEEFKNFQKDLDKRLRDTNNAILNEVDRVQEIATAMNEKTNKRLDSIESQLHANCLANSTVDILLGKMRVAEKDITILKSKIS